MEIKKTITALLLTTIFLLFISGCSFGEKTTNDIQELSVTEAKEFIDKTRNLTIIDVSYFFDKGHIPNSINYPLINGKFDNALQELKKNNKYLIYSHSDSTTISAAQKMINSGFKKIYILRGNYQAWKDAKYEIQSKEPTIITKNEDESVTEKSDELISSINDEKIPKKNQFANEDEEKAKEIAKTYIENLDEYKYSKLKDLNIENINDQRCPGCYSIELKYYLRSQNYYNKFDKINAKISLEHWIVKNTSLSKSTITTISTNDCFNEGGLVINTIGGNACNKNEIQIGDIVQFNTPFICCKQLF